MTRLAEWLTVSDMVLPHHLRRRRSPVGEVVDVSMERDVRQVAYETGLSQMILMLHVVVSALE